MEPSIDIKRAIYEIYKLIYASPFTMLKKRSLMTAALGMEEWSWRVVGISKEAVIAIARNGFKKPSRALARDHRITRAQTYSLIFGDRLYDFDEWWCLVWENDKTTLITNEEHHANQIGEVFSIDLSLGLFRDAGMVGWKHSVKLEGQFVKNLIEKHNLAI